MKLSFSAPFLVISTFAGAAGQKPEPLHKSVDDIMHLEFSKEFCQKIITEHRPRNDVTYQAGIGAEGEPVVPADLNAFSVPIPTKIVIPVTIHKQYSLETQSSGTLSVPEGKVTLPEGNVTIPPGTVALPEGTVTLPEGKVTIPEGTVTLPSGQITQSGTGDLLPKGHIKSPYVNEIPLGFVEYELESGKMTYNGKAFSSQQEALLRQKCQDVLEKSEN
ncbi:MAG: hypothetical protein GW748_04560 [Alphaproteobacteria bacterium]|nr:hypothetical protein [Alphaproteobacteria bacterium]NCQ66996.1 hypothetical protein [Alphaproteobacteria bacterium]NCT07593.1 hypothetical protein [Alphaproteobacteria bacterium]